MKDLLNEYLYAKSQLTHYKKLEAELRIKVLDEIFPESPLGTHNTYYNDYKIKAGFKNSFTINAKQMDEAYDSLSEAEKLCVAFKPSLKLAVYNELEPEEKELLDECITVKPAMPTLTVELEEE